MYGKVYLLGAGSGDPKLLTLRGAEVLKKADVVLYDRLSSPLILQMAPTNCELINVGKVVGKHAMNQEDINKIIIEKASFYKVIVRLKGGDPFVFGRGGEEILALEEHKICYEVIPGISSILGATSSLGLPLTHREIARSFNVITGHTKAGILPSNMAEYAKINGTLVFLMGVAHLKEIVGSLIANGKPKNTPVSILESGSMIAERRIDGTLATIEKIATEQHVVPPALLVIGKTAELNFKCDYDLLSNAKIGVTGTNLLVTKMSEQFVDLGAKVLEIPNIKIKTHEFGLQDLNEMLSFDWLVFTSANGVNSFFDILNQHDIDLRILASKKFAVIGKGTKDALKKIGFIADFVPSQYNVITFAEEFATYLKTLPNVNNIKVALLRSLIGSPELPKILSKHQIYFKDFATYDVETQDLSNDFIFNNIAKLDYLVFVSSSGVKEFFNRFNAFEMNNKFAKKVVCIGEQTAITLQQYQQELQHTPVLVAKENSVAGIIEIIKKDWRQ